VGILSKVNSVAGHMNAAHRNALASQRLALKQQQLNIAAQLANAQLQRWQAERDQASGIDWLDGEIANMKRLVPYDPVAIAVRSRAVLATTPHAESMHSLEHKRALRQQRAELEAFWGMLSVAAQGDAHAFVALSVEPPGLRARTEDAQANAASAEQYHVDAVRRAQRAPLWIGASVFVAIACVVVVGTTIPEVAAWFAVLLLLSLASIIFTAIRWPVRVLDARRSAKALEVARRDADATSQIEALFWSDPNRGLLLGAAVRRSQGLRELAWWYNGQDGAGSALPAATSQYR
jgi:hypothetical protein